MFDRDLECWRGEESDGRACLGNVAKGIPAIGSLLFHRRLGLSKGKVARVCEEATEDVSQGRFCIFVRYVTRRASQVIKAHCSLSMSEMSCTMWLSNLQPGVRVWVWFGTQIQPLQVLYCTSTSMLPSLLCCMVRVQKSFTICCSSPASHE